MEPDAQPPRVCPPTTFAIRGPILRSDLDGLCERVCPVLSAHTDQLLSCDVASVPADAVTIEALALLQLAARRSGCRIGLRNASADLVGLVRFLGLSQVLPENPISRPAAAAD